MRAIALFLLISVAYGQPSPDTLWTRLYGGPKWDWANCIQQTRDGGYIVAAKLESLGKWDMNLMKLDVNGDTEWIRSYGGKYGEEAKAVRQTRDGGYIVVGFTSSFIRHEPNLYIARTDSAGDTLWTKVYGDTASDEAYDVQVTLDSGFIIGGITASYGCGYPGHNHLIKIDSLGELQWYRTYIKGWYSQIVSLQQTIDGGYIFVSDALESPNGGEDDPSRNLFYVVKTDCIGDTLWTRVYGEDMFYRCFPKYIGQVPDGGYFIAGDADNAIGGSTYGYLVRTDSKGDTLWTRNYGREHGFHVDAAAITSDGGCVLAGTIYTGTQTGNDIYLLRVNSVGETLWSINYGRSASDNPNAVEMTNDGGYIIAGFSVISGHKFDEVFDRRDVYIIKTGQENK